MKTPIVGGAYEGQSVEENPQQCINLYPKIDTEGGRNSLCGTPGLISIVDLTEYDSYSLLVGVGEALLVEAGVTLAVDREES